MRHRSRSRAPAGRRLNSLSGGTLFTPASLASLALWLDPTFGLYQETTGASATTPAVADGDPVGTWKARTGQYVTAPSASARPLLKIVNGRSFVRFDGSDDELGIPASVVSGLTAAEVTAVMRSVPTSGQVAGWTFGSGGTGDWHPFADGTQYDSFGSTTRRGPMTTSVTQGNLHVWGVSSAAGAWSARVNGSSVNTDGTNTVGWHATPKLGKSQNSNNFGNVEHAELVLTSAVLSASDRASLLSYLQGRWGL
jgi:hypothetical protein